MRLGDVLAKWRHMHMTNIRSASAEMGISAATLSRVERGEPMDGSTLAKILAWLMGEEREHGK